LCCLLALPCAATIHTDSEEPGVCRIVPPEPVLTLSPVADARGKVSGPKVSVSLEVGNRSQTVGAVRLTATVFTEHGLHTIPIDSDLELAPGASAAVSVPLDRLDLPDASLNAPGLLTFTGEIVFPDGRHRRLDQPLVMELAREGSEWSIGPARSSLGTPNAPAAAVVTRKADDGSWRPPLDGPPDPQERVPDVPPTEEKQAPMYPLKFCVRVVSTYVDAGVGEDFWTSPNPTARSARGHYAYVWRDSTLTSPIFDGWLGDGFGADDPGLACTTEMSGYFDDAHQYFIRIDSRARVQDNFVYASDVADNLIKTHTVSAGSRTFGTFTVDVSPTDEEFDVSMAGAYAIYRHAGGMTLRTYNFKTNYSGSNHFSRSEDRIYITGTTVHKKFILIHEAGHAIGDFGTGNNNFKLVDLDCEDYDGTPSGCPAAGGSHSMGSKEFSKCGLGEGWAHFYAADVFNDHDETDCWFHYYKNEFGDDSTPTVSCEGANGDFVLRIMESNCDPPYGGYGAELDWMRALWDLHTDATDSPGFTEILQWMDAASSWGRLDAYDQIDREADVIGGRFDTIWDTAKTRNGIDWPIGIIFSDGFESGDTSLWSAP
jgi:hypothetical protein